MVLTSSIARAVQGVSREDQASLVGVGGLERLCRVYGSAEYLEKAMRDWSDDIVSSEPLKINANPLVMGSPIIGVISDVSIS